MRLLIIRHGDPDYVHDSLTERGMREAQLLVPMLEHEDISAFYVSPLGRAKCTARPLLDAMGRTAQEKDWLREFNGIVDLTDSPELQRAYPNTKFEPGEDGRVTRSIAWDMVPGSWKNIPAYYDPYNWRLTRSARSGDTEEKYKRVADGMDELLAEYGYRREGGLYVTEQGRNETIVLFCHFGVTCVILSHLWNVSPYVLWHSLTTLPSSVTEVYSEEREKGIVSFRASRIGDVSHLYAAGVEPSFSARFCEVFENDYERH